MKLKDLFLADLEREMTLTVYLRLNGAPVPSIYGPSADEGPAR
jgi:hypothetical protein